MRGISKSLLCISVLLSLCLSCGGYNTDPELYDINLWIDESAVGNPIIKDPNFKHRLKTLMENSAAYWDASVDDWNGWRVRIKSGDVWCGSSGWGGCTDPWNQTITVSLDNSLCLEMSPLFHEFGHVARDGFLGLTMDYSHSDPLWTDTPRMAAMWEFMRITVIPQDDQCQPLRWSNPNFPSIWGHY